MKIKFLIPTYLRPHAGGRNSVEIATQAATVREALAALWKVYPGLRDRVLDEQGAVRQHVNIFVNVDNIRDIGGLAGPVADGAEIMIVPNISGG